MGYIAHHAIVVTGYGAETGIAHANAYACDPTCMTGGEAAFVPAGSSGSGGGHDGE